MAVQVVRVLGLGLLALVLVAVFASQMLVFPAMSRGLRGAWRRIPPERRGRAVFGGVLAAVYVAVDSVLVVVAPWGDYTIVYVTIIGGGALALVCTISVAVLAIRETRGARRRLAQKRVDRDESARNSTR